jgi:aminoglycoside phosphotransferase (APT) family kinase protein
MDVDLALARRLVDDQVAAWDPSCASDELSEVDRGWDNVIVRLGDRLVLRLPLREQSAPLIEHEARWLTEVAAPLAVRAPVPLLVGVPTDYYPWRWIVTEWIDGVVVADLPVDRRAPLVDDLADALLALHRPAPDDAPGNPFRGGPLAGRDEMVRARMLDRDGPTSGLLPIWDAALAAPPWPGPALWLHGDPHARNMVAGEDGLAGLLDFGDLTSGDPANDLATAWWTFGATDRARFIARIDAAGRYDEHVWTRAAGWAAALASAILPESPLGPVAQHAIHQLTA